MTKIIIIYELAISLVIGTPSIKVISSYIWESSPTPTTKQRKLQKHWLLVPYMHWIPTLHSALCQYSIHVSINTFLFFLFFTSSLSFLFFFPLREYTWQRLKNRSARTLYTCCCEDKEEMQLSNNVFNVSSLKL